MIRKRAKTEAPPAPVTPTQEDDEDELEALLYGTTKAETVRADNVQTEKKREGLVKRYPGLKVAGYDFKEGFLLGVAPVVDIAVGASAPVGTNKEERTELITACGQGKNGALAILTPEGCPTRARHGSRIWHPSQLARVVDVTLQEGGRERRARTVSSSPLAEHEIVHHDHGDWRRA